MKVPCLECVSAAIVILLLVIVVLPAAAESIPLENLFVQRMVQTQVKPDQSWTAYPTLTMKDLPEEYLLRGYRQSKYGGWSEQKVEATGFFHVRKIGDRWWLVDPEGHLYIHKAVVAVQPGASRNAKAAFLAKYRTEDKWAEDVTDLLWAHGFNGTGAWSAVSHLRSVDRPLVYTQMWNFMASYGRIRGGTYQQAGHIGYPNDAIFVFDPEFEEFAYKYAEQLARTKDDPYLLGHFSDNELPFTRDGLDKFLALPKDDPGYKAAYEWLAARQGREEPLISAITEQDRLEWNGYVAERYLSIVSKAMKAHDPNHLYLGPRFYGTALRNPYIFAAAGKYIDAIGINYYNRWTPSLEELRNWEQWSGRPIIITEWYTKGEDSGLPNNTGAGWIVRTQSERGDFYQNFIMGLLESRVVVGWHWFRYIDNDPEDPVEDPSNLDSNKGIVNINYEPYCDLLYAMRTANLLTYDLIRHIDGEHVVLTPITAEERAEIPAYLVSGLCEAAPRFEIVAPQERETVHGQVTIQLSGAEQADALSFFIDNEPYALTSRSAAEWILDTTKLSDGYHTLRVVMEAEGVRPVERYVEFRVSNWWFVDDPFEPPMQAGWFGTIGREKTAEESAGWRYVEEPFFDTQWRKVRTGNTREYLIWDTPALQRFSLTLFASTTDLVETVILEVLAADTWQAVDYTASSVEELENGWYRIVLTGNVGSAVDVTRLKLTITEKAPAADAVQLVSMHMAGLNR